ncbi:MAG: toll/interleukin-1 receptor domain-containing protein [Bacilli bacterium]|nr:toll/interleukin-1 receptor domain-containing protein [Bacilli bacterium]MDY4052705.1 toll/interleukin-1 receptor domain-containing protein [Bacilli bacterium]
MANVRCKMCGGNLNVEEGQQTVECEYCGSLQTVPAQIDNEKILNLHNRANALRLKQDFEKAMLTYESIIAENPKDAEAHFGMLLCKYGVTYVDDYNGTKKPTINRMQLQSIFDDIDYKEAIEHSDVVTRRVYEEEANKIANIQKKALAISQKEEPYDIFICYKETDASSKRTIDSVIAQQIYDELTKKGYRVFFSRITLESKLGVEYEPYIFAALNSSKVMLVIGTKQEYFNAVWVKNEWSRFLYLMNQKPGTKYLFPCYRDMEVYDLPEEMLGLQAQDLNKIGFIQDLIRGIDKVFNKNEKENQKSAVKETKPTENTTQSYDGLLKRAKILIADNDFQKADSLLEEVLNQNPEEGTAYLYKLLITEHLNSTDDLLKLTKSIANNINYNKVLTYGDDSEKELVTISVQNVQNNIMEENYQKAMPLIESGAYEEAINILNRYPTYKDTKQQITYCTNAINEGYYQAALEFASNKRYEEAIKKLNLCINYKDSSQLLKDYKVAIDERNYQTACYYFDSGKYIEALEIFRTIPFFRDTKEKVNVCNEQIRESKYQTALTYINQKAYRLAVPLLQECSGYKDANELLISVSKKAIIQDHMYERKESFKENRSLGICFLVQFIFFIVFTLIPVFKNINAAQTTDEKIYVIYPLVVFGLCILSALVIAILGNSVKMMTKIYFVYGIMLVATAVLGIGLISSLKDLTEGSQFIDIGTKITGGLIWNFVVGIVTIVKARKKLSE